MHISQQEIIKINNYKIMKTKNQFSRDSTQLRLSGTL